MATASAGALRTDTTDDARPQSATYEAAVPMNLLQGAYLARCVEPHTFSDRSPVAPRASPMLLTERHIVC